MDTAAETRTAYRYSTPDLDEVLRVGEGLRRRIAHETEQERKTHRRMTGGLRVAPLFEVLLESVSTVEAQRIASEWRDRPQGEETADEGAGEIASDVLYAVDALKYLYQAYRRTAISVCAQQQPFAVPPRRGGLQQPWEPGSHHAAREALDEVQDCFPQYWIDRSIKAGPIKATTGGRGLYRSWAKPGYSDFEPLQPLARARIRLTREEIYANAVHELAHRMQDVVPRLAETENEFYRHRTAGSKPYRLPGYRKDDLFRDGVFFNSYAGRDPLLDDELPSPTYEIFPTGMEALFADDLGYFERFFLHGDSEHESFVLGALATL